MGASMQKAMSQKLVSRCGENFGYNLIKGVVSVSQPVVIAEVSRLFGYQCPISDCT